MRTKLPELVLPGTFLQGSGNPGVGIYQPMTFSTLLKDDLAGSQLGSFDAIIVRRTGLYMLLGSVFGPVEAGYEREFFITQNGNRNWPHKWNASANQATYETIAVPTSLVVGDKIGMTLLAYTASTTYTYHLGCIPMQLK